jgi:hypothetical protein
MEHETRFELAFPSRSVTSHTRCSLIALSSPFRWQGDAGLDFIERSRLERSYRVVSVNSGGRPRGEISIDSPFPTQKHFVHPGWDGYVLARSEWGIARAFPTTVWCVGLNLLGMRTQKFQKYPRMVYARTERNLALRHPKFRPMKAIARAPPATPHPMPLTVVSIRREWTV